MNLKKRAESLGLDEDEFLEMLNLFFDSGGADLKKLETAVLKDDAKAGYAASHSLKGSSGSLGLMRIFDVVVKIDNKLRIGDLDGVNKMVAELRKEYDKLVVATCKRP